MKKETTVRTMIPAVLMSLLMLCGAVVSGFAFDVVGPSGTNTTIVIPDKPIVFAPDVEVYAAQELQYHIKASTGVTLPIVKESQKPTGTGLIYLGTCRQTKKAGLTTDKLAPNACIIRLLDGDLFMVGDDQGQPQPVFGGDATHGPWNTFVVPSCLGTLFAVYEFLEKQLGVKWLWPGKSGEIIPKRTDIRVQRWNETWTPPFISTHLGDNPYMVNIFEPERWSSPAALTNHLYNQTVWLRRQRFAMGVDVDCPHSFKYYWNEFGETNPEFFNLLPDGTRRFDPTGGGAPESVSMCVSQPGLWKTIVAKWAATRSAGDPFIKLGENDTLGKCTCPACLAWDVPDPESKVPFDQRLARAKQAFAKGDPEWAGNLGSLSDRYARFYMAVQQEAEKIDANATVLGLAYANFTAAPLQTRLNKRVMIVFVPNVVFPWTKAMLDLEHTQWNGWRATGARMQLRPNYFLQGHNMPLFFARKFGRDFNYLAKRGLLATKFDSLTGRWSTQGPNLYMLARVHTEPGRPVDDILDAYYSGFGCAKDAVRNYFRHWEKVSDAVTGKSFAESLARAGDPNQAWGFLMVIHTIFTPEAMSRGRALLAEAQKAAQGDPGAEERVAFLERGLREAELTLTAQSAFRAYKAGQGDFETFGDAVKELDRYRRSVDTKDADNVSYMFWFEGIMGWDHRMIYQLMNQAGEMLPAPWKFMWDPEKQGESKGWRAEKFDDSRWLNIKTDAPYEDQEAGKQWKAGHKTDYLGLVWYRTTFSLKPAAVPQQVRLVFGAVDEACTVWVNGKPVLERPFPFQGDGSSWQKAFEIDITGVVNSNQPNTLAVRVENNAGAGGVFRPVWLQQTAAPDS